MYSLVVDAFHVMGKHYFNTKFESSSQTLHSHYCLLSNDIALIPYEFALARMQTHVFVVQDNRMGMGRHGVK